MRSKWLALLVAGWFLAGAGGVVSACAGTPAACQSVCEDGDTDACQQCLLDEKEKREEARRQRAEELRRATESSTPPSGGGTPGGY